MSGETDVLTFDGVTSRTVAGIPDDPRYIRCPECQGRIEPNCWMCVGVGIVYAMWVQTKPLEQPGA